MTKNQFANLCLKHCIEPGLALENDSIVSALRNGASMDEIEAILENEF